MASKEVRGSAVTTAYSTLTVCMISINTDVSWWMEDKPGTYTVRLLSFRTGIIKKICVNEITLLLFSF